MHKFFKGLKVLELLYNLLKMGLEIDLIHKNFHNIVLKLFNQNKLYTFMYISGFNLGQCTKLLLNLLI